MNTGQRILAIRLCEKLSKDPVYAKSLGVRIINKKAEKAETKNSK